MTHHSSDNHHFLTSAERVSRAQHKLPASHFGMLTGNFNSVSLTPRGSSKPDDNHVYILLRIPSGALAGVYECAFNTHSNQGSNAQYAEKEEDLGSATFPSTGFVSTATLSYHSMGLKQTDFQTITGPNLATTVMQYAQSAYRIAAFGFTYSTGDGIHDIHYNNGEKPGAGFGNHPNQDGALVFYFAGGVQDNPNPSARWIFIKFDTQTL